MTPRTMPITETEVAGVVPGGGAFPAAGPDVSRIFVDCTETHRSNAATGIPRVVRNLVGWGRRVGRDRGVIVQPVRFEYDAFVPVPTDGQDAIVPRAPTPRDLGARVKHRLRKALVSRRMRAAYHRARRRLFGLRPDAIEARDGDVLLLPDSSWDVPMWEAVDRLRCQGAAIGVVQHDFIPMRNPDLVPAGRPAVFRTWAHQTLRRADFVMAVSETVADEVRQELRRLGRHAVAARCVSSFRNGSDFSRSTEPGPIRRELLDFLAGCPAAPFLTVGTMEPRKNQALVARAIDAVLAGAPDAAFLFVGVVGWRGGEVAARLRGHPAWMRRVAHFTDLSDAELAHAYGHARALVFPSLAEGFGLPIVEALASGTRVFASDIPVHREIGGDACVFFDPRDPAALAARIVEFATTGSFPANWPATAARLTGWREAAEHVVDTSLARARRGFPATRLAA